MKLGFFVSSLSFSSHPIICYPIQGSYSHLYGKCCTSLGGSSHTDVLNRVESKALRLVNSPPLPDCLRSLKHRRNVAFLVICYHYFNGFCSHDLTACRPHPRPGWTILSLYFHPYSLHPFNVKVNQHLYSIIPFTGKFWVSLSDSVIPSSYDLNFFKERSFKTPPK